MEEIWRAIPGYEMRYVISNHGRLKSINGKFKLKHPDGYISLGTIDNLGYRLVYLRNKGINKRERIHRLVAMLFVEKGIGNDYVNHIDGNKLNNHYTNLEWCTPLHNIRHAINMGLIKNKKGENHFNAKIKESDVIKMRDMRSSGMLYEEISKHFNISRRQVSDVVRGINWGWLRYGLSDSI